METGQPSPKGNPPSDSGNRRHLRMTDLSLEDRPREKMLSKGVKGLTPSELLAVLIGSGIPGRTVLEVCQDLMCKANNNLRNLYDMSVKQMQEVEGIGPAKALVIKAALELGHQVPITASEKIVLSNSKEFYEYLRPDLEYLDAEELWIVYLRNNLSVIDKEQISKGGQTRTQFDLRIIMRRILEMKACAVVMAHNHPSGSLTPSKQDKEITSSLKKACDLMQIKLLDHIIVGDGDYYSFEEEHTLDEL